VDGGHHGVAAGGEVLQGGHDLLRGVGWGWGGGQKIGLRVHGHCGLEKGGAVERDGGGGRVGGARGCCNCADIR